MTPSPVPVSSILQWVAKVVVFAIAAWLALEGKLNAEAAGVFSAALIAMGITNGATLVSAKTNLAAVLHQVLATLPPSVTITTIPPPPPAPATSRAIAAAGGAGLGVLLVVALAGSSSACQAPMMSPEDHAITATEFDEQHACIDRNKGNPRATDLCRASVRKRWDAWWAVELDGGHE